VSSKPNSHRHGAYIQVYLAKPLADFAEREAARADCSISVWLRDLVHAAAPEDIQQEALSSLKYGTRRLSPGRPPPTPPEPPKADFDALVEMHRERVLELAEHRHKENAIAAIAHLPFKVVQHILTSKATPKRGPK
jgi:hypothetical protein